MVVRLPLYAVLLAVLVLVLLYGRAGGEERPLVGATAQGEHFELTLEDGEVRGIGTYLVAECPGGERPGTSWTPEDGDPVPFHHDGRRFGIREDWEQVDGDVTMEGSASLVGRVSGGSASGRMGLVLRYAKNGREYAVCRVSSVRWRASAS